MHANPVNNFSGSVAMNQPLSPKISSSQAAQEESLLRRQIRPREVAELTYEFTKDPGFLHQYYVLRSMELSKVLPAAVPPAADKYDERAHIMVVRQGRQVVGGGRIITRQGAADKPLYVERGGWDLFKVLPELELAESPYCEISKLYLLEEYQNSTIAKEVYRCIVEKFNELGMGYGFATSSIGAARIHRRSLRGLPANYTFLSGIKVPTDGAERADNRSFQVLNLFDTLDYLPQQKARLMARLGIEGAQMPAVGKDANTKLHSFNNATLVMGSV